ncbi:MAG: 30S ribosomal protein S15 [Candidatus Woesearchaeota archaeon]|nr:30S ribosomal protein S15 [Candidatus Woesearchaeota archaeon]MDP7506306.1 30S ribosomal protein S15 [Candidatus Woesearchaeota archaeon]MDP7610304.1 30S ribosomal protein S15 [Candidatus Woesearchaeota archaeon]
MARMHSRKLGKAGSTKPSKKIIPTWSKYKAKEAEILVKKLAKEGNSPSKIGIILRDTYGIPDVSIVTKKKITKILEENKLLKELPEDLMALIKKAIKEKKHMENNKHDKSALRGLQLTESKIKRLVKYYKRTKKLPFSWKFEPKKINLYIE